MAATLISYTDKTNNSTSGLAADKKVSATDMNEIKDAVNDNAALHDSLQSEVTSLKAYSGATSFNFTYDSNTAAGDPGTGKFRANTALPATWTILYVSASDLNFNIDTILASMIAGSYIYIQDREDPKLGGFYTVFSVTDNTTYFTFVLNAPIGNSGSLTNGDLCELTLIPVPTPASGDVATDTIWDVKGDLALATGSNTASVMSAGTNGQFPVYDSTQSTGMNKANFPVKIGIQVGAAATDLAVGTAQQVFRMPFDMTLTAVQMGVTVAPTGATLVVDINESGASVLSTKLSIDATEKTSRTAATPAVISDSALAEDNEITIDIDQVGSTVTGQEITLYLIGYKNSI